ncbi:hypothetical protein M758_9G038100 [Ceratodon purpureus]|nr:hypothetical protein M758_9G038100 [Ceratodon purpureus]
MITLRIVLTYYSTISQLQRFKQASVSSTQPTQFNKGHCKPDGCTVQHTVLIASHSLHHQCDASLSFYNILSLAKWLALHISASNLHKHQLPRQPGALLPGTCRSVGSD